MMKLPAFDYAAPVTLGEALGLLAAHEGRARPLAGGQSLIPLLAFRLADPSLLVDLRKVPDLDGITISDQGVRLGAMVRWCDIEADPRVRAAHPLLAAAVRHIAHYQIRNRGTVGGSLAHADPAAELPGIAVTCEAQIVAAGSTGSRMIRATDFFLAPMTTALEPDELIVELRLPPWPRRRRWAFEEFARQRGAFALAAIALFYDEENAQAINAHIGVIGTGSCVRRLQLAEEALSGHAIDRDTINAAANAAAAEVDPVDDAEASAAYRRALVATLVTTALERASTRHETQSE